MLPVNFLHPPEYPSQELSDLLAETDSLQSGTGERDDVIVKLADELDRVTVEHDAAKRANSKLNRQQASADMPQVLDYVNQARCRRMQSTDCNQPIASISRIMRNLFPQPLTFLTFDCALIYPHTSLSAPQKSREFDLRLLVKNQERKVELAEMGAKRARLLLREAVAMGLPVALPPGMGGDGGGGGSPVRHARTGAY